MKYLFIIILFILTINARDKIATIPEASGISHCKNSNTLIVVNDEGTFYEITTNGEIILENKLGLYDLEGAICEDNRIIFVLEDRGLLITDRDGNNQQIIDIESKFNGKKISIFHKKHGIEGIAKVGNLLYLAKQSKKKKKSFIVVVDMNKNFKIVDILKHRVVDTAGLAFYKGFLYMVSDKKDKIIKYDLKKRKIIKKYKLSKGSWEGIALTDNFIYLADDDGEVIKFNRKKCKEKSYLSSP